MGAADQSRQKDLEKISRKGAEAQRKQREETAR
jgi:hypothetical protein